MYTIPGHHHVSMLTKTATVNNHFYQHVLGLRRVKKTVNQDNPTMYHLFYGDLTGSAGTELSFFEMPIVGRTVRGTNAITQIGLLVSSYESLVYWKARLDQFNVENSGITTYAGRDTIHFEDPDGLRLILLNHNGEEIPEFWSAWGDSPVEEQHRVLGLGSVEITVRYLDRLANLLKDTFGYAEVSRSENEAIYQSVAGKAYGEIVIKRLEGPNERNGKGSVHHLAIRVNNDEELRYWDEAVKKRGFESTGIVDRFYFKSLYFRESNGILFEIATDGPGFTADSSVEDLGKPLDLPPFLEERRAEIEAKLTPID
ncbi:ring-cleaving dioxygenase [Paenibacillus sp. SC116]|uniref:ring-cleaving dioxygenase n=1 Tax=Paenibacillus sp. SC116 TaxID=2968986 RepID=UPI00215B684D|nr:ring-cleaving dioxygenase [Paenibacillus sp. SC116]MCR8844489.1 ring-cleaving dioxygenase [Paenibacillus sp. SC116]